MKNKIIIGIILFLGIALLYNINAEATFKISNFQIDCDVQENGDIEIEENITVTPATAIATPQTAMQNEKITKAKKIPKAPAISPKSPATAPPTIGITTGNPTQIISMIKMIFNVLLVQGLLSGCPSPYPRYDSSFPV